MYNNIINYTFSKEVYDLLLTAYNLSKDNKVITLDNILRGLFLTKNIVSYLLKIHLNPYLINNNSIIDSDLIFSKESIIMISDLLLNNKSNKIINTISIFNYLLKNYLKSNKYILKYSNLKFINYLNKFYFTPVNSLKDVLINLTLIYCSKIINRCSELDTILVYLKNFTKNNIFLSGKTGIGRFSIIKGLKHIYTNKVFYILDILQYLNAIYMNNQATLVNIDLKTWLLLNSYKIILIVKDIDLIINSSDTLSNLIYIILNNITYYNLQVIITILDNSCNDLSTKHPNLLHYFYIIYIKELYKDYILKILKQKSIILAHFYKITIPDHLLNYIFMVSNNFIKNKVNPVKVIELLNLACSYIQKSKLYILTKDSINKAIYEITKQKNIIDLTAKTYLSNLEVILLKNIFGQKDIIYKISNTLKKVFMGIKDDNKPLCSWLFCGPSGTGKTELARLLAFHIFGSFDNLIRFDMSEYMEKHTVSKLIGSPPGYVGYGTKGLLVSKLLNTPYSVVLFDEIEKAHSDILNLFLQLLDNGKITDSTGDIVDFSNTIIIFTSNLGCPVKIVDFLKDINNNYYIDSSKIYSAIRKFFKPELLNRLTDIMVFQPLSKMDLLLVLNKFLNVFRQQLDLKKIVTKFILTNKVKLLLVKLSLLPMYGARPLKRTLDEIIINPFLDVIQQLQLKDNVIVIYDICNNDINKITYTVVPL